MNGPSVADSGTTVPFTQIGEFSTLSLSSSGGGLPGSPDLNESGDPLICGTNSKGFFYISFFLNMSNACWDANCRIRLRSPGKLRSTTSTLVSLANA
jgi:hypothetical protein